jgi:peptide/nickel transport system substrate-binding protein
MRDWKALDGTPFPDLSFEDQTYEYARRWALNRRRFLGGGLAVGGLAVLPAAMARAQARGGHLIIGRAQGSDSLDNHKAALVSSSEVQAHIYDPLAVLDARTGKVYPSLALSWTFEDHNKTAIFKLRPGVKFHDGTPFNADAVVETVKRHLAPETRSPTKFLLGPLMGTEKIDDLTVAYKWSQAYVALWAAFLLSYCSPQSPAAVKKYGDKFGRHPVGTGPFRFVSWDANDVIRLERNPDRNWECALYKNHGAPYLASVEYRTIPEPSTRLASLLSGEVDLLSGTGNAVPNDKVRQLTHTHGIKVVSQTALGVHAVVFSENLAPMGDVRVRRAICHAMDRAKALAFALDGGGKVATSPLGSGFLYYDPTTAKLAQKHDIAKAKALFAEAGVKPGTEFSFLSLDDSISRAIAEILQAELNSAGMKLKIDILPAAEYSALRRQGKYHMAYLNYSYSDADILRHLLAKGGPLNISHHSNERIHKLCLEQAVEFDSEKRKAMLWDIQEITVREAIWLPVVENNIVAAMRDGVSINLNPAGQLILSDVSKKA